MSGHRIRAVRLGWTLGPVRAGRKSTKQNRTAPPYKKKTKGEVALTKKNKIRSA